MWDSLSILSRIIWEKVLTQKPRWEPTVFGQRLKALRAAAGLTQVELGKLCGIVPNTLAKYESGKQEPAWPIVLKIAQGLGVSCSAFTEQPDADSETLDSPAGE